MNSPRRRTVPVERGDRLELTIDSLGDGPDGIAHIDEYVVLVPGVLPGERVSVAITSAARKFGRGELLSVLEPSPQRIVARCAHFLACGGCHRQHQAHGDQLADQQQRLQRTVDRALAERVSGYRSMADRASRDRALRKRALQGITSGEKAADRALVVTAARPGPPFGQRRKIVLHLRQADDGRLETCFHRLRSPELVAVNECPASDPHAWALAQRTVRVLDDLGHGAWDPDFAPHGLLRSVLVRTTTTGEAHVVVVARSDRVPGLAERVGDLHEAGATTVSVNGNPGEFSRLLGPDTVRVSGPARIREQLADTTFLLSPTAFFQTSAHGAAELIRRVTEWLAPTQHDDVADLYCGVGLLTLPLARTARSVLGIELNLAATQDGAVAAQQNGLTNVTWRAGHVEHWLRACSRGELPRPHLVALDPPRAGLADAVIAELRNLRPRKLAYVSCDLQALHKDLGALAAAGFRTERVHAIDMFPQTCHVEAIACLAWAN